MSLVPVSVNTEFSPLEQRGKFICILDTIEMLSCVSSTFLQYRHLSSRQGRLDNASAFECTQL